MRANPPQELGSRRSRVGDSLPGGAFATIGRILPLAAGVSRGVRRLGLAGLAAAAAIALIVVVRWTPGDGEGWAGLAILAVLLAVPAAVLFAFSVFLGEVVELPDKLRNYPGLTREHAAELQ